MKSNLQGVFAAVEREIQNHGPAGLRRSPEGQLEVDLPGLVQALRMQIVSLEHTYSFSRKEEDLKKAVLLLAATATCLLAEHGVPEMEGFEGREAWRVAWERSSKSHVIKKVEI